MCGRSHNGRRSFGARTLSLTTGAAGGAGLRRAARAGAFARTGQFVLVSKGSDGGTLTTLWRRAWEDAAS